MLEGHALLPLVQIRDALGAEDRRQRLVPWAIASARSRRKSDTGLELIMAMLVPRSTHSDVRGGAIDEIGPAKASL